MDGYERLKALSERMKREVEGGSAPDSEELTVRELLSLFTFSRRGSLRVRRIRHVLAELDLRTVPDFERAWIDQTIVITLDPDTVEGIAASDEPIDPTVRIGEIDAANRTPTSVDPNSPLSMATTLMLMNDFSQLPVMQNERDVKGIISWKSIATKLSLGRECGLVRECMDPTVPEVGVGEPLFSAIEIMQRHGYVLVRARDRRISGIVTWGDVTHQFIHLAGPFLTIGEIEGYLRSLVHRKFTAEEIQEALPDSDRERSVVGPEDLTLGGYWRLLGRQDRWERLGLDLDRREFVEQINWVRERRNDVTHFDPDGPEPEEIEKLEGIARFFRGLRRLQVM